MFKNKKSFLLYCDIHNTVSMLPDEYAGKLFKHILAYVNDLNPTTDDMLLQIAFEPIKQTLIRDLDKYNNIIERNKDNGSKGGRPKKENPKNPVGYLETQRNPKKPKKADIDIDSVIDSDIDSVIDSDKLINKNIPSISEFSDYAKTIIQDFKSYEFSIENKYNAWIEAGWKDGNGKKIVNWKSKLNNTIPYLRKFEQRKVQEYTPKVNIL